MMFPPLKRDHMCDTSKLAEGIRGRRTACGWEEGPQSRIGTWAEWDKGHRAWVGMHKDCLAHSGAAAWRIQCPDVGVTEARSLLMPLTHTRQLFPMQTPEECGWMSPESSVSLFRKEACLPLLEHLTAYLKGDTTSPRKGGPRTTLSPQGRTVPGGVWAGTFWEMNAEHGRLINQKSRSVGNLQNQGRREIGSEARDPLWWNC